MTGNTKVWRAPLAGLASVAMIATMGVAASTANAATDEATLTFKVGDSTVASYTESYIHQNFLSDYQQSEIDGTINANELSAAVTAAGIPTVDGKFTGWANGSDLEVVTNAAGEELADPQGLPAGDVTLTARYSKDPFTVKFDTKGVTKGGVETFSDDSIILSDDGNDNLDKIPSWAVPTTDAKFDNLVAYHKDGKTLAKNAYWTAVAGGVHVDPTASDLFDKAFADVDTSTSHATTLTLTAAQAVKVSFVGQAAVKGTGPFTITVNGQTVSDPFELEVATGETINDFVDFPVAQKTTNPNLSTNEWYAGGQVNDEKQLGVKYTASTTVSSSSAVVLRAGVPSQQKEVTLYYQDKTGTTKTELVPANQAYAPADLANITTSSVEYKFAGWYVDKNTKYVPGDTNVPAKLYAHWDIAAVKFVVDPNYGQAASKSFWVSNGKNFKLPVASDYRSGWTATLNTKLIAYGKNIDNFNMYMVNTSSDKNAKGISSEVALKYEEKNTSSIDDTKSVIKTSDYRKLEPGFIFKFSNWTKATYTDLVDKLRDMEKYVTITKEDGSGYIEGKDQSSFTADSFNQYVSDYQDYDAAKYPEGSVADVTAKIEKLAEIQAKLVETSPNLVYRAYNPNNGDHYFTTNKGLYDGLVKLGWRAEGTPYAAISAAEAKSRAHVFGTAIYSAYNPNTGEHLLTSETEANALAQVGWKNEGVYFYAPQGATEGVYRLYNPNTNGPAHVYTGTTEYKDLVKIGWRGEDLVFSLNSGK